MLTVVDVDRIMTTQIKTQDLETGRYTHDEEYILAGEMDLIEASDSTPRFQRQMG